MITRRQFLTVLGSGAALAASTGGYAFALEPRFRLIVTEWDLATAKWTHERPLRIVALADIHACEPWMPVSRIEAIVEKANTLEGDIVLLLGDFMAGLVQFRTGVVPPEQWAPALGALKAPLGVHAIAGNHDWWTDIVAVRDS